MAATLVKHPKGDLLVDTGFQESGEGLHVGARSLVELVKPQNIT